MKEKDYSDLENKEITYIDYQGIKVPAIVIGCDTDVGITIVAKDDKKRHLVCLNGPSSPNKGNYREDAYKTYFYYTIAGIKKGLLKWELGELIWDLKVFGVKQLKSGVQAKCAYNA